ncbi:MAG: monovalent cation/H(+) antiporter subunit G [Hyphomicrobiaceae bacterium]
MTAIDLLLHVSSWVLILIGSFFLVAGGIGLVRLPDVFTRMHGASVIDSMGSGLLLTGLLLQAPSFAVGLKLVLIFALILLTTPVAAHALAQAAIISGIEPELTEDRRPRPTEAATAGPADLESGES